MLAALDSIPYVSVLYREPKLLKVKCGCNIATISRAVSVLYREPKLLKVARRMVDARTTARVSVLYREPKLLKDHRDLSIPSSPRIGFSALP